MMIVKKNIIILFVLFVVSNIVIAQNTDSYLTANKDRCSIKINPLQLLCGEARILFEKPVSQHSSFEIIGSYVYDVFEMIEMIFVCCSTKFFGRFCSCSEYLSFLAASQMSLYVIIIQRKSDRCLTGLETQLNNSLGFQRASAFRVFQILYRLPQL